MKVLVTGADGFVGMWLVRELLGAGHRVVGAIRLGAAPPRGLTAAERTRVDWHDFDLLSAESVAALGRVQVDAVVHLAAVASGSEARRDPGHAWTVNAAGTARLVEVLGTATGGGGPPRFLFVSTGEVYGSSGERPHREQDPIAPCSPYAASKAGAELAVRDAARRLGMDAIVARPFPHTGPGQSDRYVIPALARRLLVARRIKAPAINTGNLEPVRDLLDVRDVVVAYRLLLEQGTPGAAYNVASGTGHSLRDVAWQLMEVLGYRAVLEADPNLARAGDLPRLVGDSAVLAQATGWSPRYSFQQTLKDLVDAQAD